MITCLLSTRPGEDFGQAIHQMPNWPGCLFVHLLYNHVMAHGCRSATLGDDTRDFALCFLCVAEDMHNP